MKIAITGHRPDKLGNDYELTSPLIYAIGAEIEKILSSENQSELELITGMALGIDTLFAKIAIQNKVSFIAAVPFIGQEKVWKQKSQTLYHEILSKAKEVVYVCEPGYASWKLLQRNKWMVDNCDKLIAVYDESGSGGTAHCVDYAKQRGKEIIFINPNNFR